MIPDQTIELTIPAHPRYLQMVRAMMERIGVILDLPGEKVGHMVLAVDEASSNIIKHAYDNEPSGKIEFRITLAKDRLDISITDYGRPCNPCSLKSRDLSDIRPGGLGIYIIGEVMDEVTYTCYENNKNRIRMVLNHPA